MRKRNVGLLRVAVTLGFFTSVVALVPLSGLAGATDTTASAASNSTPALAGSPFQVRYDGQYFPYSLPDSSIVTFTINPQTNTVTATETDTSGGKLVKGEELQPEPAPTLGAKDPSLPTVTVNSPSGEYPAMQAINGFGGAMTESSAELINNSKSDKAIMNALFSASGADFNLVRVPMGASDFVTGPIYQGDASFSYDDNGGKPDPKLVKFSIGTQSANGAKALPCVPASSPGKYGTGDYSDVIPALECAKKMKPSLNLLAVPWSAPGWMKIADSTVPAKCKGSDDFLNSSSKLSYYATYAEYFLRFLTAYQSANLPVSEVSMQNEPENCKTNYPTMEMAAGDQATFAQDLYAQLDAPDNGLSFVPQIMAYDDDYLDNSGQVTTYPKKVIAGSGGPSSTGGSVGLVGFHSYNGSLAQEQDALDYEHMEYPSVPIWMTEATGFFGGKSTEADNLVWEGQHDLMEPLQNWASASLYLNLVLNPSGDPHHGGCGSGSSKTTPCRGMITLNSNGTYTLNEDYFDWAQFSKFVQPGATHICSTTIDLDTDTSNPCSTASPGAPTTGENMIDTVAFQNPGADGSIVLVAMNTTPDGSVGSLSLSLARTSGPSGFATLVTANNCPAAKGDKVAWVVAENETSDIWIASGSNQLYAMSALWTSTGPSSDTIYVFCTQLPPDVQPLPDVDDPVELSTTFSQEITAPGSDLEVSPLNVTVGQEISVSDTSGCGQYGDHTQTVSVGYSPYQEVFPPPFFPFDGGDIVADVPVNTGGSFGPISTSIPTSITSAGTYFILGECIADDGSVVELGPATVIVSLPSSANKASPRHAASMLSRLIETNDGLSVSDNHVVSTKVAEISLGGGSNSVAP